MSETTAIVCPDACALGRQSAAEEELPMLTPESRRVCWSAAKEGAWIRRNGVVSGESISLLVCNRVVYCGTYTRHESHHGGISKELRTLLDSNICEAVRWNQPPRMRVGNGPLSTTDGRPHGKNEMDDQSSKHKFPTVNALNDVSRGGSKNTQQPQAGSATVLGITVGCGWVDLRKVRDASLHGSFPSP